MNKFYTEKSSPQKSKKNVEIPKLTLDNLFKFKIKKLRFVNRDNISKYILDYFNLNTDQDSLSQKIVINLCQNFGAGI
jgi:hypothetical protein